jgi:hypothetical protein
MIPRDPYAPGARAIAILSRTAHLGAMAVLVGGRLLAAGHPSLRAWTVATVVTGLVLLLTEMSHSRSWVHQGRGLVVFAHVGAFGLLSVWPTAALAGCLVVGAIGSHLPRSIRKWSLRHRRIVD